jgi:excisionase family DNA binding protein
MDGPREARVPLNDTGASRVETRVRGRGTDAAEQQIGRQIAALVSELGQLSIEDAPLPALSALLTACASTENRIAVRMATASVEAPDAPAPQMLTATETAARLNLSRQWVYRATRAGHLPFARRIGDRVMYDPAGLARWLDRQRIALAK